MANLSAAARYDGHGVGIDVSAALHDAGVVGLWEYRLDCGLVYADSAMAHFYGLDPDNAHMGLPPEEYRKAIHPHDVHQAIAALRRAIVTGQEYRTRYRVIGSNGASRLIETHGRPTRIRGKTVRLTGVNIRVEEAEVASDSLSEMANLAMKIVALAAGSDDPHAIYFAKMLLAHIGDQIARQLIDAGNLHNDEPQ